MDVDASFIMYLSIYDYWFKQPNKKRNSLLQLKKDGGNRGIYL
jgi:hypothetical protein